VEVINYKNTLRRDIRKGSSIKYTNEEYLISGERKGVRRGT